MVYCFYRFEYVLRIYEHTFLVSSMLSLWLGLMDEVPSSQSWSKNEPLKYISNSSSMSIVFWLVQSKLEAIIYLFLTIVFSANSRPCDGLFSPLGSSMDCVSSHLIFVHGLDDDISISISP